MNRKLIYTFSLVVFFLMWGVFGFAAAAPRGAPDFQATVPQVESTPVPPGASASAGIPVTGKAAPVLTEVFVFYGLIGVTALFLILALLNIANRSTAHYIERKNPPSDETQGQ
jgi:hypothetical protein